MVPLRNLTGMVLAAGLLLAAGCQSDNASLPPISAPVAEFDCYHAARSDVRNFALAPITVDKCYYEPVQLERPLGQIAKLFEVDIVFESRLGGHVVKCDLENPTLGDIILTLARELDAKVMFSDNTVYIYTMATLPANLQVNQLPVPKDISQLRDR